MTRKPIVDPHAGQLQVVISFRLPADSNIMMSNFTATIDHRLRLIYPIDGPVDVAVRVIGAQSETSEHEGRWDRS